MNQTLLSARGFTRVEILVLVVVSVVLTAVLYPVFTQPRSYSGPACISNAKQIGTRLLMYAQDYDETFPPGEGMVRLGGRTYPANWALDRTTGGVTVPGLIFPHLKNPRVFRCPTLRERTRAARLTYRYSDLAARASLKAFTGPANTVLVSEGEDLWSNVGHAWTPDAAPVEAVFNRTGTCDAGRGATVQNAPTRHAGQANYVFADGHAKQLPPIAVFFPPQNSDRDSHQAHSGRAIGPDPAMGKMTFAGKTYQATFHVQ